MTKRYLRAAPDLLLWGSAACIWWLLVPRLLGVDLPYPIALLSVAVLVPFLTLREIAFVLTDRQVRRGERIGLTMGTSAFVLGTCAVLLSPALVFAWAFGLPVPSALGLILVSDLGVALLAAAAMCLTVRPAGAAKHG